MFSNSVITNNYKDYKITIRNFFSNLLGTVRKPWTKSGNHLDISRQGIFNLTAEVVIEQLDLQKTIPRGGKKRTGIIMLKHLDHGG